jgi:hypothetical protein
MAKPEHHEGREAVLRALREELLGPAPAGDEKDFSDTIPFETKKEAYGPFRQEGTGEEVLIRNGPSRRYGLGILYPFESVADVEDDLGEAGEAGLGLSIPIEDVEEGTPDQLYPHEEPQAGQRSLSEAEAVEDGNDSALTLANSYRPSSMGVSFLAEIPNGSRLVLRATGGRYRPVTVVVEGQEREWWGRVPVDFEQSFEAKDLRRQFRLIGTFRETESTKGMNLVFEVLSRKPDGDPLRRLLTVALVNRTVNKRADSHGLFQATFEARIESPDGDWNILPYPRAAEMGARADDLDDEEATIDLLYRNTATYAMGHGCAADWEHDPSVHRSRLVKADPLPVFETPSITPDIKDNEGNEIKVSMAVLAGLVPSEDGFAALEQVIALYESWINARETEVVGLESHHQAVAERHLQVCRNAASRMKMGLSYLRSDSRALRAFQLANHAILAQQARSRPKSRSTTFDRTNLRFAVEGDYPKPNLLGLESGRGYWRAFQIAFLLLAMESTVNGQSPDRETVELIWFPTGGGKTEAYLGLAAFAIFMRRLENPDDAGVNVLMRYTLRLLTTQQFQRAARLLCAMEFLRQQNEEDLGQTPFSIGMWVGQSSTPNTRAKAVTALRELQRATRRNPVNNPFAIDQCPWCGAQMGPIPAKLKDPRVVGYEERHQTVVFVCPDRECVFSQRLPIYVIDEDVYESRPTLVIGTVDKFALLAWKPEARSLFGLGEDGQRMLSPPELIIQDELHLIAGPLGSMVGLYEAVIDELCTDRRPAKSVRPKIVSSTATTRRYAEQIKALYARPRSALFPPPGLDASDSFFGRYATEADGKLKPGRMYVGVHAPGLGSMQTTEVRAFTALVQAPMALPMERRDPWWTLLIFFNSLRELGTTLSLFQSDIRDYQKNLVNRTGRNDWRGFGDPLELTGRANYDEVKGALTDLAVGYPSERPQPVDICLASSMLEVGVDIDRLALMGVVGQPKTTAQYIQVTGRVGRQWWKSPGLVVTLYAASRPRDRSHFEKFRSYHEKLYAQVEPASVTPFSPPALDRALHGVILSYVRQFGDAHTNERPWPFPEDLVEQLRQLLMPRIRQVDEAELENFERVFNNRAKDWKRWQPVKWTSWDTGDDIPLIHAAGEYMNPEEAGRSWATPLSLRNVDAGCVAAIMPPPAAPDSAEES